MDNKSEFTPIPAKPYKVRIEFLIAVLGGGKKVEFARLVGKHPSTITQVANGKYRLTTDSKKRLIEMDVNLNWLEEGHGEPFTEFNVMQTSVQRIGYFIEYGRYILGHKQESIYHKNASNLNRQLLDKFKVLKPVPFPEDFDF